MLNKEKKLVGNHTDLLAIMPLNSYDKASREPLPKYVIDKSWFVPKLSMQKSTPCAETVNRAFQRTGPR